jgi:hypothetical protein
MKGRSISNGLLLLQAGLFIAAGGSILGIRFALLPWNIGLLALAGTVLCISVVGFVSLVLLFVLLRQKGTEGLWQGALCFVLSCIPVAAVLYVGLNSRGLPLIHDISTDTEHPPSFVALAKRRGETENSPLYQGDRLATLQKQAYPDIKSVTLPLPPEQSFLLSVAVCQEMGWEVIAKDMKQGRIEAVATTAVFHFQDDVVLRIRPEGTGSLIDVRSASRVGVGDLGANAKRIRVYLQSLESRVLEDV